MTKEQAEAANWRITHEWATGLDLTYAGVDLADCAAYALLSTLGRVWLAQTEQGDLGDGSRP